MCLQNEQNWSHYQKIRNEKGPDRGPFFKVVVKGTIEVVL